MLSCSTYKRCWYWSASWRWRKLILNRYNMRQSFSFPEFEDRSRLFLGLFQGFLWFSLYFVLFYVIENSCLRHAQHIPQALKVCFVSIFHCLYFFLDAIYLVNHIFTFFQHWKTPLHFLITQVVKCFFLLIIEVVVEVKERAVLVHFLVFYFDVWL